MKVPVCGSATILSIHFNLKRRAHELHHFLRVFAGCVFAAMSARISCRTPITACAGLCLQMKQVALHRSRIDLSQEL